MNFLKGFTLSLAILFLVAMPARAGGERMVIAGGTGFSSDTWPVFLANHLGYFSEQGLEVVMQRTARELIAGTLHENVTNPNDGIAGTVIFSIVRPAVRKGVCMTVVSVINEKMPFTTVHSKDVAFQDMRLVAASPFHLSVLKAAGASPDLEAIKVKGYSKGRYKAFRDEEKIEGAILYGSWNVVARYLGHATSSVSDFAKAGKDPYQPLVDGTPMMGSAIVARCDQVAKYGDRYKRLIAGIAKAKAWAYDRKNSGAMLRFIRGQVEKSAGKLYDALVQLKEDGKVSGDLPHPTGFLTEVSVDIYDKIQDMGSRNGVIDLKPSLPLLVDVGDVDKAAAGLVQMYQ